MTVRNWGRNGPCSWSGATTASPPRRARLAVVASGPFHICDHLCAPFLKIPNDFLETNFGMRLAVTGTASDREGVSPKRPVAPRQLGDPPSASSCPFYWRSLWRWLIRLVSSNFPLSSDPTLFASVRWRAWVSACAHVGQPRCVAQGKSSASTTRDRLKNKNAASFRLAAFPPRSHSSPPVLGSASP